MAEQVTYIEAISQALREEMQQDERVFITMTSGDDFSTPHLRAVLGRLQHPGPLPRRAD